MNRYVRIKTYLYILPEISGHRLQLKCIVGHFFLVPSLHREYYRTTYSTFITCITIIIIISREAAHKMKICLHSVCSPGSCRIFHYASGDWHCPSSNAELCTNTLVVWCQSKTSNLKFITAHFVSFPSAASQVNGLPVIPQRKVK